jgi:O-antigen/teichoic acid export membrane protein
VVGPLRRALKTVRRSNLARHVAPLWGAEGVVLLTGLVQALVVARVLGPREYGVVALAMATPTLLFTFFDPQAYEAVVRYVSRFVGEGDADRAAAVPRLAYAVDGALAFAGLAVVMAVAPWAADHVLKAPGATELVVAYGVGLCASAPLSTSRAVLTSFDRFRVLATVGTAGAILRTALVVSLVGMGLGASGVVYGSVVGLVLECLMMGVAAERAQRATTGRSWRSVRIGLLGADRRAILAFMLHTELVSLAGALVKHADVVVLGAASGPQAAGHYRLAWQLVSPMTRITLPLQQVFYARSARMGAVSDWEGLRDLIRRQTRYVGAPLAAVVLAAIPVVVLAVPSLAGRDYAPAAVPAAFLLVGTAAGVALFWVRPAYLATGLVRPLVAVSTIAAVAGLVGFVLAAPWAGAAGVAAVRGLFIGVAGGGAAGAWFLWRVPGTRVPPVRTPQKATA